MILYIFAIAYFICVLRVHAIMQKSYGKIVGWLTGFILFMACLIIANDLINNFTKPGLYSALGHSVYVATCNTITIWYYYRLKRRRQNGRSKMG